MKYQFIFIISQQVNPSVSSDLGAGLQLKQNALLPGCLQNVGAATDVITIGPSVSSDICTNLRDTRVGADTAAAATGTSVVSHMCLLHLLHLCVLINLITHYNSYPVSHDLSCEITN